ncbi:UDP-N-acetylmuramoyl-tripeptide--D-alanyl-D-alanine ligase [Mycobacterium talmoniae]|uniref:UDP-N-acetylmuramoyl-tripeptide--D-alanyl-D-alanine ligase n=1 Tax=Mycobacterium talmoniae TaxID=1858794 RepID=A0A2S8BBV8_9MYCO|nr:UDP-N-acetylmuramoyl-tripeptide--D-alanyl-D-alanine ligase [Mycobacterium talmoniae]
MVYTAFSIGMTEQIWSTVEPWRVVAVAAVSAALLAAVLAPLGQVVAPPGSFNNELGHPWTVLRATEDTDYLILEMSARHPGNIAALATIAPPQIAVVLNVGTAHLGEFGSREAIAATKAELPQAVPASGVVVLNADDAAVAALDDHRRHTPAFVLGALVQAG